MPKLSKQASKRRDIMRKLRQVQLVAAPRPVVATSSVPSTTNPVASTSSNPVTLVTPVSVSSATKRKLRFYSPGSVGERETETATSSSKMMLVEKKLLEKITKKMVCKECYGEVEALSNSNVMDTQLTLSCTSCGEQIYSNDVEKSVRKCGKRKFYPTTMNLVYSAISEGLAMHGMQRMCSALRIDPINNRQWLKYKLEIRKVAKTRVKKHFDECTPSFFNYYQSELGRLPDNDGFLDMDVTYDGECVFLLVVAFYIVVI